jgi:hypothetical protein
MQGVRHVGPGQIGDTNATFALGLTTDNGATFVTTALNTDAHKIVGIVRPEAAHVNQAAKIFVVERLAVGFQMRNVSGNFVPWNGVVAQLVPYRDNEVLGANHTVDYFNGTLTPGEHRFFIGYQAADGILRYTNIAHVVTITTGKTARELAMDAFTANISANIVQGRCIACHVAGGQAQGQSIHTFVPTSNPNHLSINFTQFENLLKARGRTFVLAKVRGENLHVGGVQLTANSQDYRNLDAFLQLLEKL